jgi:hypothetical protein
VLLLRQALFRLPLLLLEEMLEVEVGEGQQVDLLFLPSQFLRAQAVQTV